MNYQEAEKNIQGKIGLRMKRQGDGYLIYANFATVLTDIFKWIVDLFIDNRHVIYKYLHGRKLFLVADGDKQTWSIEAKNAKVYKNWTAASTRANMSEELLIEPKQ